MFAPAVTPLPAPLRPLLESFLTQAYRQLPGALAGFYVLGSVALEEFNPACSDVDFIALLHRPLTGVERAALLGVHQQAAQSYPRWPLSGGYAQLADLTFTADRLPTAPHYHDGRLRPAGTFDLHSADGWTWQHHGLALLGPQPATLPLAVDWPTLIARMHANTRGYWGQWATGLRQRVLLLSEWGVQWAVLGVLRQWYTYRERSITTKSRAGEYSLRHLPAEWHPLVREALALRAQQRTTYHSRLKRAGETVRFLHYVIAACQALERA